MGLYIYGGLYSWGLKTGILFWVYSRGGVLTGTLMCDFIVWFTEKITYRVGLAM